MFIGLRSFYASFCLPVVAVLLLCGTATAQTDSDNRGVVNASIYTGLGIDTFASGDLKKALNPDASSEILERGVAGVDFEYRLWRPDKKAGTTEADQQFRRAQQLWVYGETMHGVRSADVDCKANPDIAVCKDFTSVINATDRSIYILRNATSLEAFMGFRYEFSPLNFGDANQASLYVKSEVGFLTVSRNGGDVADSHLWAALGAIMTAGKFQNSFLQVGFGKTDLYGKKSEDRWKVDGYLEFNMFNTCRVKGFAEMTADADFGHGSDSVQTFLGITLDPVNLFKKPGTAECN